MRTQKQVYDELIGLLSISQYRKMMGTSLRYSHLAIRAKQISKSKKVHALADEILSLRERAV